MHHAGDQPRNTRTRSDGAHRAGRAGRPGRWRLCGRAAVALLTAAGTLAATAPGAAALDSAEVEDCSDDEVFCSTLTVKRPTAEDEPPPEPTGSLNYCSPYHLQDDGSYTVDICDHDGNFIQTLTLQPSKRRPRPKRSTVVSSAMGALNPPKPTIHTSPSYRRGLLVQTPTWLWVPASYWRTYSTTIVVWGYVVTIFATPTAVRWKMGNGDSITCLGPGNPWVPGFSDSLSSCKYTYRHSSDGAAGNRYKITATVTFAGHFTTVGLGAMRGPLGAVTRSTSVYAPVAEIQGLVG